MSDGKNVWLSDLTPTPHRRIAMLAIDICLPVNGHELIAPEAGPFILMTRPATRDDMAENVLAEWIRVDVSPLRD